MAFQNLENKLLYVFAVLTNPSDLTTGYIVGSVLSFTNLCKTIGGLAAYRYETQSDLLDPVNEIVQRSLKIQDERNTYIHSYYPSMYLEDGLEVIARIKHKINKQGYRPTLEDHDPEKIKALTSQIQLDVALRIKELIFELRDRGLLGHDSPDMLEFL